MTHWSSCSIHNAPALPVGPCDCGDDAPMSADIIQFIPRPNPNRDLRTLEQQAIEIMNVALVEDTTPAEYVAPEEDPA